MQEAEETKTGDSKEEKNLLPPFHRIARIRNDFPEKFGIPRQSGLVEELEALIIFEPEYRNPEALRGLEEYSHIWLIWEFSESVMEKWSPTVRPPRLGGNTRMGVPHSGRIPSGCPACVWKPSNTIRSTAMCSVSGVRI